MRPLPSAAVLVVLLSPHSCFAQSIYRVSIDTSRVQGSSGVLVFDMTSNTPMTNRFDVINFSTDGAIGPPETQGEFILGDLIQRLLPAGFTRINADTFFTELALPLVFGDQISFTVNVSETAPLSGRPPDELSLYLLGPDGRSVGMPANGSPNLSVTITGQRGGLLQFPQRGAEIGGAFAQPDQASLERSMPDLFRQSAISVSVTPVWTLDDPARFQNAQTLEGILTEFCDRRCAAIASLCTGGAYGLEVNEETFYAFDDVSGLMAQVALVNAGKNPLTEGQFGHAKVLGVLNNSVLTVQSITLF